MIEGAVAGRITVEEAASLLQLSERQVKRLKQRSSDGSGAQWVYHGNRERTPANRTAECLRQQVVSLAREKYSGFNDSHFQQKLEATEKVSVSRSLCDGFFVRPESGRRRNAGLPSTGHGGSAGHRKA